MSSHTAASSSRQALGRIAQQFPRLLESALSVRDEVMAASLSKTYKVCGKPSCKCAHGDKHEVYQLSWTEHGKRRSTHISRAELAKVQATVERYRRLRQCRADLLKLAAEAASLIDDLVEALQVSPPNKRGGGRK